MKYFGFLSGCKIMLDAGECFLSIFNQLDLYRSAGVSDFEDGEEGAMDCLNRMGIFDCLIKNWTMEPNQFVIIFFGPSTGMKINFSELIVSLLFSHFKIFCTSLNLAPFFNQQHSIIMGLWRIKTTCFFSFFKPSFRVINI